MAYMESAFTHIWGRPSKAFDNIFEKQNNLKICAKDFWKYDILGRPYTSGVLSTQRCRQIDVLQRRHRYDANSGQRKLCQK